MTTLVELVARLRTAGCVFAEREAELICRAFTNTAERERALARREAGEPLEYVVGTAEFAGVSIAIGPPAFIPRVRAVALVDAADLLAGGGKHPAWTVLDLGCGAGPIAAALSHRHPAWDVHACDNDPATLRWARHNASTFGYTVHDGDWFDALPVALFGRLDLVVAHLPYVPTANVRLLPRDFREHEPPSTVDGGPDGLDPLREVAGTGRGWLSAHGVLLTQVARGQASTGLAIAAEHGFTGELMPAATDVRDHLDDDLDDFDDAVVLVLRDESGRRRV